MLRLNKLTDYGLLLMAEIAQNTNLLQAAELALSSGIPRPTVAKILQILKQNHLLIANTGTAGGYRLAKSAKKITIADIIKAIEGPIAITECSVENKNCDLVEHCSIKTPLLNINKAIVNFLESMSLQDLIQTGA